jgi:6-phosphogluconolactonase
MLDIAAFPSREALMQAAAARIAEALAAAVGEHGRACAVLSGGGTPEPAYAQLAGKALDWARITFALVDERFVPPTHEASNEKMLRRALAPALAQGAQFAPMYASDATVAEAALRADALYAQLRIDIAVMGMGADAHTASWFAGAAAALDPANPRTVVAVHAPQAAGCADRLTLTRAAYNRARRAILLIMGEDKRARLRTAAHEPLEQAPVAALLGPDAPPLEILWTP